MGGSLGLSSLTAACRQAQALATVGFLLRGTPRHLRLLGGPGRQATPCATCRRRWRTAGACRAWSRAWSALHASDAGRRQPAARRPRRRPTPPRLPAQPAARPARSPGRRLDQLPGRPPGTGADLLGDTANGPAGVVDRLAHLLAGLSHRPTRADSLLGLSADLVQRPGARPAWPSAVCAVWPTWSRVRDTAPWGPSAVWPMSSTAVSTVLSSASRSGGCGR
jgi:hypothetical protein